MTGTIDPTFGDRTPGQLLGETRTLHVGRLGCRQLSTFQLVHSDIRTFDSAEMSSLVPMTGLVIFNVRFIYGFSMRLSVQIYLPLETHTHT
jgi:hypothetical protein